MFSWLLWCSDGLLGCSRWSLGHFKQLIVCSCGCYSVGCQAILASCYGVFVVDMVFWVVGGASGHYGILGSCMVVLVVNTVF